MRETKQEQTGGACLQGCGGTLVEMPAPSAAQRAAANHRENPATLPPFLDNAPEEQIEKLGALFKCDKCGYRTRIKPAADDGAAPTETGKAKGAKRAAAATNGD